MCDVIIACISRGTFHALAAMIFLLAVDCACSCEHVFVSQLLYTKICGNVGYRNAFRSSKNFLVLIQLVTAREDFKLIS